MPKSAKDDFPNRASLDEFVRGARRGAALKAALELELFTRIAEGQRSLPALLRVTGLNERGLRLLLDALANLGLLVKSPFEYVLPPTVETFLVKGKPAYYGDALLAQIAWEARGQLARAVRSGKPAGAFAAEGGTRLTGPRALAVTPAEWQAFAQALDPVWDQLALSSGATPGVRALAFGAGAGLCVLALALREAHASVLVVDTPAALAALKTSIELLHVKAPVELLEGDWLAVPLPAEPFDLAFVDSVTAYRSLEQNVGILHRALEALRMGGQIVLRALMADEDRRGPGSLPLIGLDILLSSVEGDIYTVVEYRGMLEAAGFFDVRPIGERAGILAARRSEPPPPPPPAATVAPDFIPPPETLL